MQITYLNGRRLARAIKAASLWISQQQQELNDINVYPVPDSDTGTNMVSTMRTIAENVDIRKNSTIAEVSETIADSALNGARGNSGAILAQFFHGLAEGLKGKAKISTRHFSVAVHRAVERSYEALANPKEGTILTVIKAWGDHIKEISERTRDFTELMGSSLQEAKRSLEETPRKLKKLARAGVVDAGGLGFVYMIEGITDFIRNGKIREMNEISFRSPEVDYTKAEVEYSLEQITHRYCIEFYLVGEQIPVRLLREELQHHGDSVIVAGAEKKARIHIHTDDPRQVFDFVQQYGEILEQKVDDMYQQHTDAHAEQKNKTIAIVTDSSCDLPNEIIRRYNIHMVPLRLYLDDIEYIDKVTIQPEEFYSRFTQSSSPPKTSQPTPKDFLRVYENLSKHYQTILSINLSGALSGTYQSAVLAAKQIPDADIRVIDSRTLSVALGLVIRATGEAIEQGMGLKKLIRSIYRWIENCKLIVSVETVEYLVKGGRVSKGKGILANLLKLVPILTISKEGKAEKIGMAKPGISSQMKVMEFISRAVEKMKDPDFAIVHVAAPRTAEWYQEQLQTKFQQKEISVLPVAPVLGAHAGPGAAAIAVLDKAD